MKARKCALCFRKFAPSGRLEYWCPVCYRMGCNHMSQALSKLDQIAGMVTRERYDVNKRTGRQ